MKIPPPSPSSIITSRLCSHRSDATQHSRLHIASVCETVGN